MPYLAEISRKNPACLIFLIDQSGSMSGSFGGGKGAKKDAVADVINRLLYNLILRCAKEDGIRDYFYVGVFGYGINNDVQCAFENDLMPISWVASNQKRTEKRHQKISDGAGGLITQEIDFPIWFEPVADGGTPMFKAFQKASSIVDQWIKDHPTSFPPIIINITDGAYTDASPLSIAQKIMNSGTEDGNSLIFNCHISGQMAPPIYFPNDAEAQNLKDLAKELYEFSSVLPPPMRKEGITKGYNISEGGRGFVFNADIVALIDFVDIGTRIIQDRVEGF